MSRCKNRVGAIVAAVCAAGVGVHAGDLAPPVGPVAPTMKDLDDVEPRIALRNDFVTLTPIVINSRGSYYLAEHITALFGEHGIEITSSDVTLDLNGFTIEGNTEVGSLSGIKLTGSIGNVTVLNGTVRSFFDRGIDALLCPDMRIEGVRVIGNGDEGILTGDRAIITRCHAVGNTGRGINCGKGSVVESSTAEGNGSAGIDVDDQSVVRGCASRGNSFVGIDAGPGSSVSDCVAENNGSNGIVSADTGTVTSCASRGNTVRGISAGDNTVITGCVCEGNTSHGILAGNRSLIKDNICTLNGTGSGIRVVGGDNRVEGNTLTNNDIGLDVTGSGNLVVGNSASDNTPNYSIGGGNDVGAIVFSPIGAGAWDNFEF